jgi:hypothetical protein
MIAILSGFYMAVGIFVAEDYRQFCSNAGWDYPDIMEFLLVAFLWPICVITLIYFMIFPEEE